MRWCGLRPRRTVMGDRVVRLRAPSLDWKSFDEAVTDFARGWCAACDCLLFLFRKGNQSFLYALRENAGGVGAGVKITDSPVH